MRNLEVLYTFRGLNRAHLDIKGTISKTIHLIVLYYFEAVESDVKV
jgi:hypothetical protein